MASPYDTTYGASTTRTVATLDDLYAIVVSVTDVARLIVTVTANNKRYTPVRIGTGSDRWVEYTDSPTSSSSSSSSGADSATVTSLVARTTALETNSATKTEVTAEATARASADTALSTRLTAVENSTAWASATALSAEVTARSTAVSSVQTSLTAEANTRAAADTALATRVSTLEASAGSSTALTSIPVATSTVLGGVKIAASSGLSIDASGFLTLSSLARMAIWLTFFSIDNFSSLTSDSTYYDINSGFSWASVGNSRNDLGIIRYTSQSTTADGTYTTLPAINDFGAASSVYTIAPIVIDSFSSIADGSYATISSGSGWAAAGYETKINV